MHFLVKQGIKLTKNFYLYELNIEKQKNTN